MFFLLNGNGENKARSELFVLEERGLKIPSERYFTDLMLSS
jgi:hypothetical protein